MGWEDLKFDDLVIGRPEAVPEFFSLRVSRCGLPLPPIPCSWNTTLAFIGVCWRS